MRYCWIVAILLVLGLSVGGSVAAMSGKDPGEEAEKAAERTARDMSRAQERADRDGPRAMERADRDESRFAEERAKIMEDAAKDPEKAAEDLAKLEEEIAEEIAEAAEDAADESGNSGSGSSNSGSGSNNSGSGSDDDSGSSTEMQDLGHSENPEYDDRGFPIRRGEIAALDLGQPGLAAAISQGFRLISRISLPALDGEIIRLRIPENLGPAEALSRIRQIDKQATFDYTHYYGLNFSAQGSREQRGKASLSRKKGSFTIGMIDTAVASHKSLKGVSVKTRDFGGAKTVSPTAHGTAIASILASEGGSTIFAANVFRRDSGKPFTSADMIVGALEWMVAQRVPVINMSLAGPRNAILDRLIKRVQAQGTIIVAAAGNGGPTAPPAYPAAVPQVVAVTAVDRSMRVYRYANQGKYISVSARGVSEPAAKVGGGIALFSGTSYATPHISAWFARCLKRTGGKSNSCHTQLQKSARDLGAPGHDPVYGYGYIE